MEDGTKKRVRWADMEVAVDDEMDEDYLQKVSLERGKSLAGTWEGVCFRGLDWFAFKVRS